MSEQFKVNTFKISRAITEWFKLSKEQKQFLTTYIPEKMNLQEILADDPARLIKQGFEALWWKQPFAGLMLHGKIETRTWSTSWRGWVLIVASKAPYYPSEYKEFVTEEQFKQISEHNPGPEFVSNVAIAIGRLVNCRPMRLEDEEKCFVKYREPWMGTSRKLKKQTEKRLWCHEYEDVQAIEPFEMQGVMGWVNIDESYLPLVQKLRLKQ